MSSVKLSIKAANGCVVDYKIDVQTDWTILQLKNHLYRHYPTHPPLTSQKLIHGGRLLLDQQTIEQCLPVTTQSDGPIIVHLVAYERSVSAPALSSTTPDRTLKTQISTPSPQRQTRSPASRQPSLTPVQEGTDGGEGSAQTQAPVGSSQHSQQPTTNGINRSTQAQPPWLRYRGSATPFTQLPYGAPVQTFPGVAPGMMPMGGYPFPAQFYMSPYGAAYANQMAQWYYSYYGRQAPPTTAEGTNPENNLDLLNPQDPRNNEDVAVEDDVPMNAAGGAGLGMMAGGGGAGVMPNRRDLVDYLYMFTMLGFLLLVAYLTGSIGRLLVFAGGIIFMLLNQGGWFALRRRQAAAPQREDVNPLMRAGQLPEGQAQNNVQEQQDTENNNGEDSNRQENNQDDTPDPSQDQTRDDQPTEPVIEVPPPQNQQRPGILATLLVFVTSFFTSLVPHQRPELQVN